MKISTRLKEIADMIPSSKTVIDVGCDHGLLGIYLILTAKCEHIINTDISEKAIESAKKNVKKYNLEKRTSFFVTDGLKGIPWKEEDILVLSGMGAYTMLSILENASFSTLILSAQKDIPHLRREMVKKGYKIEKEKAIFDKKWYVIMRFQKGNVSYKKEDYLLGPFLKKDKKYLDYLEKKEEKISLLQKKETDMLSLIRKQKNL